MRHTTREFMIKHALALLVLTACVAAGTSHAQPLADRVPSGALVYVGWSGTAALGEAYDQSTLKKTHDAGMTNPILDMVDGLQSLMSEQDELDAEQIAAGRQMVDITLEVPCAMYVLPPQADLGEDPLPLMVMMWQAGDHAGDLEAALRTLTRDAKSNDRLAVSRGEGLVTLQYGGPGLVQGQGGMAAEPGFAKLKDMAQNAALTLHVDTAACLTLADRNFQDAGDFETWSKVKQALGLPGLKRVILTAGFETDGPGWVTQAFVEAPAPRQGILSLLDQTPLGDAELGLIPRDAVMVAGARFDVEALYKTVRRIADTIEPQAGDQMDGAVDMASGMVGVDLRQDLIAALGDVWLAYVDPAAAGPSIVGVVLVNPVRDAQRVTRSLDGLVAAGNAISDQQAQNDFGSEPQVKMHRREVGEVVLYTLGTPFVAPSFAVHNGKLLVGLYPQPVLQAATTQVTAQTSILANPAFAKSYQQTLPAGTPEPQKLWWVDLPATSASSYQNTLMWNQMLKGFGEMMTGQPIPGLMPPLVQVQPLLAPEMMTVWTDDAGLHLRGWSPFPGASSFGPAGVMGGGGAISGLALATGIMLPALGAANLEAAGVELDAAARQVLIAQHLYANDHDGRFADDIAELVEARYVTADLVAPGALTDAADPLRQPNAQAIRQHSRFALVPGLTADSPVQHVLVVSESQVVDGNARVTIARVDGTSDTLTRDEVDALLQAQVNLTIEALWAAHRGEAPAAP